jgi:D-glycero-D-manno-heptose 1,7-bisphosphate phosphatase
VFKSSPSPDTQLLNKLKKKPAVFLDRDGTINLEVDHLRRPDDLVLLPKVSQAIALLNSSGIPAILITNQADIGRGLFDPHQLDQIHGLLTEQLAASGAHLDGIYYCPHRPEENCACRKPRPGLLFLAAKDHELDLAKSVMIGDKLSDIQAGISAGCHTILELTGYGQTEKMQADLRGIKVDFVAEDLWESVNYLFSICFFQPGLRIDPGPWLNGSLNGRDSCPGWLAGAHAPADWLWRSGRPLVG